MVPYFQANPKITYAEAATDLGVSVKQLIDDLNQLWMCGLPGYGPGDLIDFVLRRHHRGHVLRGHRPPAAADLAGGHRLLVALRAWSTCPAWSTRRPRAARSPRSSRPRRATTAAEPPPTSPRPAESDAAAAVATPPCAQRALADRVLLGVPRHAVQPDRRPHPGGARRRPQLPGGVVPAAEGVRLFRFDRIVTLPGARRVVGAPATRGAGRPRHLAVRRRPVAAVGDAAHRPVASWMFDYYPLRVLRELPDGACEAAMTYASDDWMARFVLGFGSAVRVA